MPLDRTNRTLLGRWWWTVDRLTLIALGILMVMGGIIVAAASPAVAERINLESFYFLRRQLFFLVAGGAVIFFFSLQEPRIIRRIASLGLLFGIALLMFLPFFGEEKKGAIRWFNLLGVSLQPSEFLKPCFAVFSAWMFSEKLKAPNFPGFSIALFFYGAVLLLLLKQPDVGMAFVFSVIFFGQFFLAGLPLIFVALAVAAGIFGMVGAYIIFPHVTERVDKFLNPQANDTYQVDKSLEAFASGGIFGRGPGEGVVKQHIPDSHTDFIFSVVGEEMGLIACLMVIAVFAFITVRGFMRVYKENDYFIVLAVAGILINFAVQAIINIGVTLEIMPTKGMTLPFVSYGGSSVLAASISMGMLLALTRRRYERPGF